MTCAACNDSGKLPSSDFLDCTVPGCAAAADRVKLEDFACTMSHWPLEDVLWAVHQRATEAQAARIAELEAKAATLRTRSRAYLKRIIK